MVTTKTYKQEELSDGVLFFWPLLLEAVRLSLG